MKTSETSRRINDCWNQIGTWRKGNEVCNKLTNEIHCQNCNTYKEAGLHLLDRELPAHYKSTNALAFSHEKIQADKDSKSLLIFKSNNGWYALNTSILDEICAAQPVHKLPHNPSKSIEGLINIRGEIEICLSLNNLLECDTEHSDKPGTHGKIIVIQLHAGRFAILADEISGIFRIDITDVISPPVSVSMNEQSLISGIIDHNEHQVGIFSESSLESKLAVL